MNYLKWEKGEKVLKKYDGWNFETITTDDKDEGYMHKNSKILVNCLWSACKEVLHG